MAISKIKVGNTEHELQTTIPNVSGLQGALDNKAPKSHASSSTTYGQGTGSNYGHVKLSDATDSTSAASAGIAASPKAVKAVYDLATSANSLANETKAMLNGITWTKTTMPLNSEWWSSITYGNGKFVAVCEGSDKAVYSTDGINWIETNMYWSDDYGLVTYGDNYFVAIARESGRVVISPDGITWVMLAILSDYYAFDNISWKSITYGNGKFIIVAHDCDIAAYAVGASGTWTEITMPFNNNSIAYGNNIFVDVPFGSDKAAYSTDGINWTETTMPSHANWTSVTYGNGKFVTIARDKAAYSTDGINWTETTMPFSEYESWDNVTYGHGKFLATTYSGRVAISNDGIIWTETTAIQDIIGLESIACDGNKFVALDYTGTVAISDFWFELEVNKIAATKQYVDNAITNAWASVAKAEEVAF